MQLLYTQPKIYLCPKNQFCHPLSLSWWAHTRRGSVLLFATICYFTDGNQNGNWITVRDTRPPIFSASSSFLKTIILRRWIEPRCLKVSHSLILGILFFIPFSFPNFANGFFSIPFPFPNFGNGIIHPPSHSRTPKSHSRLPLDNSGQSSMWNFLR